MRRVVTTVLALALAFAMLLPATAMAGRGGVPSSENGRGAAAAKGDRDVEADVAKKRAPGRDVSEEARSAEPRGNGRAVAGANAGGSEEEAPGDGEIEQARERVRSQEASDTVSMKRTGIANALDRLEANLARMQADLEAGSRSSLPPGLQRAIAKFISWLGVEGHDESSLPDDGDGSEETSGTVETSVTVDPDDGSGDDGETDGEAAQESI